MTDEKIVKLTVKFPSYDTHSKDPRRIEKHVMAEIDKATKAILKGWLSIRVKVEHEDYINWN